MDDRLDGFEFVTFVRRRWTAVAIACAVAVTVSAAVCFVLPERYTASASILIEPPAGNDPRGATAVSPVYLESLKTYERLAASDTVFAQALDELQLRRKFAGVGIEAIKRRVLKVSKPTNTKIIEISVTLDDPDKAHKLAQYLAEQAVALNRKLSDGSSDDLLKQTRASQQAAALRLKNAQEARNEFSKNEPVSSLDSEVSNAGDLKLDIERHLSEARAEVADLLAQQQSFHPGDGNEAQAQWTAREAAAAQARVATLEGQHRDITKAMAEKALLLDQRRERREMLDIELRAAHAEFESATTKLNDIKSSAAFRGERLEIMDPGIVPQRPSFPNTPVIVLVSFLAALLSALVYLALRFGYLRLTRFAAASEYSLR